MYKFVERRNVDVLMGEIWDDSECSDWTIEDRAIELGDDVGATLVLRYDDERTEISRTHFAIERLLNSGISDEDKVAEFEVILDDGGGMLLFETDCGLDLSGVDVGGKCCQVRPTFLQGDSAPSNQVGQGKRSVWWRKQVRCFGDVEGQKWVHAGGCEVWGTAHTSADCDSVGPHDGGDNRVPSRLIAVTGLE